MSNRGRTKTTLKEEEEMSKRIIRAVVMVVAVVFMATGAYADQNAPTKQIKVVKKPNEVQGLHAIKNPHPGFKVKLWTNKKDATYKVGENVVFYFKTNKDCRLTLFNVGTSGKVHILFPNKYQKDNLVKAGKVYRIPAKNAKWEFKAQGPAGVDLVKAIAVATPKEVKMVKKDETKPIGPLAEVKKPQSQLARDIAITLKPVPEKRWTEAEKELRVKP